MGVYTVPKLEFIVKVFKNLQEIHGESKFVLKSFAGFTNSLIVGKIRYLISAPHKRFRLLFTVKNGARIRKSMRVPGAGSDK